ncbi:MAG: GIN domain-containing protein [Rhodothalassiaceae bacterium]
MRTLYVVLVAALASPAMAQESRSFDLPPFSAIDADGGMEILIEIGQPQRVVADYAGNAIEDLQVEVDNGVLEVKTAKKSFWGGRRSIPVTLHVTVPSLEEVVAGAGMELEATGLDESELTVTITTGAIAALTGRCGDLQADVSTGGVLKANALQCDAVEIEASTGAVARVHGQARVEASANTGASVKVFGRPNRYRGKATLGGTVERTS